jgi:hypothetical protein
LKKTGHIDGENTGHNLCDGEKHGRNIDGKPGVGEEGIELVLISISFLIPCCLRRA